MIREMYYFLPVVRIHHLDSNIASNICYASIDFENVRFARTTSEINTF